MDFVLNKVRGKDAAISRICTALFQRSANSGRLLHWLRQFAMTRRETRPRNDRRKTGPATTGKGNITNQQAVFL